MPWEVHTIQLQCLLYCPGRALFLQSAVDLPGAGSLCHPCCCDTTRCSTLRSASGVHTEEEPGHLVCCQGGAVEIHPVIPVPKPVACG